MTEDKDSNDSTNDSFKQGTAANDSFKQGTAQHRQLPTISTDGMEREVGLCHPIVSISI